MISQAATIIITWPLWQPRLDPPTLPVFDLPNVSFGVLLLLTLVGVAVAPRPGLVIHIAILVISGIFDQFRLQPQFYANALLLVSFTSDMGSRLGRWFCVSLWLWAGIHKAVSFDWWGPSSFQLLKRMPVDLSDYHVLFAALVAVTEILAGVLALFRPKWAMFIAAPMHLGILFFLIAINWNYSVFPWNLSMAVGGTWLMFEAWKRQEMRKQDSDANPAMKRWEWGVAVAALVLPAGFYTAHVDHGFAHVLYSASIPRGVISNSSGGTSISGWGELAVPFPNERRLLRIYFERSAEPGDKLHITEERVLLDDLYYQLSEDRKAIPISAEEYYTSENGVEGIGVDRQLCIHKLGRAGAKMLRRDENAPVYAIEIPPSVYRRELLKYLVGLPNLEQIQLQGTSISDDDLSLLPVLPKLNAIGLSNTKVSDLGIKYLRSQPRLERVDCGGTDISQARLDEFGFFSADE